MSSTVLSTVIKAVVGFVATNLDELVTAVVFFSSVDGVTMSHSHVVLGQLFAFTIVLIVSALGVLFGAFISIEYVALIGFLPLGIGLHQFYGVCLYWYTRYQRENTEISIEMSNSAAYKSLESCDVSDGNLTTTFDTEKEVSPVLADRNSVSSNSSDDTSVLVSCAHTCLSSYLHASTLTVTLAMLADGSEEIGIFLPLFATSSLPGIIITVITFYLLLFVQIWVSYAISVQLGSIVSRYSKNLMPLLLVALGLYVLSDSVLYTAL